MPKKILLVGSGAREHAIGEAICRSPQAPELYVFAKTRNPGLTKLAKAYCVAHLNDFASLEKFVKDNGITLAFIGPEEPLGYGTTDFLQKLGVKVGSPTKSLARLETEKSFVRNLIAKYKLPGNPIFKVFTNTEGLEEFMRDTLHGEFVVKAEGLHGGKGVKVVGDHLQGVADGLLYATECIKEEGKVVVEEKFVGEEFSLMSLVDGKTVLDTPAAQDHKRAFAGDRGPNTGGMGSISDVGGSLPFLSAQEMKDAHEITVAVMQAMEKEYGEPYHGVMYGGFIATRNGVRLIEYNARFGDPETMNVLPILKTDFVTVIEAIAEGHLGEIKLEFEEQATVCKYIVPEGYPDKPVKDQKIAIGKLPSAARVYYASVEEKEGELYLGGSRAIAVLGIASSLKDAGKIAEEATAAITGPVFHREDIGTAALVQKRIEHMRELRR